MRLAVRSAAFFLLACISTAALASTASGAQLEALPDDPLHRVAELYVDAAGTSVEYSADFTGRLHVWVRSTELDPSLSIAQVGKQARVDLDSGGGGAAWIALEVLLGDELSIAVRAAADAPGSVELHVVAAPETELTQARARDAEGLLARVASLQEEGDRAGAGDELYDLIEELERVEGSVHSEFVANALDRAGQAGFRLSAFDLAVRGFVAAHDRKARFLSPDHPNLLRMKQNAGIACLWSNDLADSDRWFSEVFVAQARLLPPDHPDLLVARENYALTRKRLGDAQTAFELYESVYSTRVRTLPPDHHDSLRSLVNVATTKFELGDLQGAHADFEYVHSVWVRELPPDHLDLLRAKANLGLTSSELGDLERALELHEAVHATRLRLLPPDHPEVLGAKQRLGSVRRRYGDLAGYRELAEEVHAILAGSLDDRHPSMLLAQQNLGLAHLDHGEFEAARALLEHVHDVRSQTLPSGHPDLMSAKMNLAVTLRWLLDTQGALELDEEVHATYAARLDADHPDLLGAKQNLAASRSELGDHEGAMELEEHVHDAWQRLLPPDHPDLLTAKQNLAVTRKLLGDYPSALELEEHVLSARLRLLGPDHPDLLSSQQNLGLTRQALGDLDGALELFELVLAARERLFPSEHPDRVNAVMNLALVRYALGDPAEANELFECVYAARKAVLPIDHPSLLDVQQDLAAVRVELGDFERARSMLHELMEGQLAVGARLRTTPARAARSLASRELERLASAFYSSRLVGARDEVADPDLVAGLFEVLETLRSVSTHAGVGGRATRSRPELREAVHELARVRQRLAGTTWTAPQQADEVEGWRARILALSEERDRRQGELLEELAADGFTLPLPRLAQVAAGLASDAALVSYWRCPRAFERDPETGQRPPVVDSFVAFVVTAAARVELVELGPAEPIEALLAAWRASQGQPLMARGLGRAVVRATQSDEDGERLRSLLLDPVLERVSDVRVLHVVLDDCLHLLPLEALPCAGELLGQRMRLRHESNVLRLMGGTSPVVGGERLVALGGVDYEADIEGLASTRSDADFVPVGTGSRSFAPSLSALPGAAAEVGALVETYRSMFDTEPVLLVGAGATKAALTRAVAGARWLHLATHGWFAPDAVESTIGAVSTQAEIVSRTEAIVHGFAPETLCGLALAGANRGRNEHGAVPGILTAEELATLDLSNCELAVLSACETNVGLRRAGQGIQSLQTALHAAGAGAAITSLWKVDDAATRKLFERFYQELWGTECGKADALWRAKMALRAAGHPAGDWAGWILTGDPN